MPLRQNYTSQGVLHVRTTGDPGTVLSTVRSKVQQLDRHLALTGVNTIKEIMNQGLYAPRMGAALLSLFGLLALLLSNVGIYGVLAYNVNQRTHEIGLRMALGAKPADVFRMVVGQGLWLVLLGIGLGLAAAFGLTRFFSSLLYGVSATDPVTFVGIPLMLSVIALVACYLPAERATRVDPVVALRYE